MWLHLAQLLENFARFASNHRTQQKRLVSYENSGEAKCFCARNKCFGKSLFGWSYRTKIVVGGRKIKQLDLHSLGYEDSGQACLRIVCGR